MLTQQPTEQIDAGQLLTATQFGAAIDRQEQTIREWVEKGLLNVVWVGCHMRFRAADIPAAIEIGKKLRRRGAEATAAKLRGKKQHKPKPKLRERLEAANAKAPK